MKLVISALYVLGYLVLSFAVVWFGIIEMDAADPKLKRAVSIYYPIWTIFYAPVAVLGLVFTLRRKIKNEIILFGLFSLLSTAVAQLISLLMDAYWPVILAEFIGFLLCYLGLNYILNQKSDIE
ncbi:MAG: hypothetical protein GVY36_06715 [Verrucomicrobia bacterium]|jgi:hypothetical protein|nr:hypothetical protein [Verrucomicrobiota bacterium]